MNRVPILAGGAVLAAVVLCCGAVTMASAMGGSAPTSEVLRISGVTTTDPTGNPTSAATAAPTGTATPTPAPGDDGVTVVTPAHPTAIDGKGSARLDKSDTVDSGTAEVDHNGATSPDTTGDSEPSHPAPGTPVVHDPEVKSSVRDDSGTTGRADASGDDGGRSSGDQYGGGHH